MNRVTIQLGLIALLLPTVACDKLLHRNVDAGVDAAAVDSGASVDAGAVDAGEEADAEVDAGATTTTTTTTTTPLASGLVGTYVATAHEGPLSYSLTATLNASGGTVSYGRPFDCQGTWSLVSHDATAKTWKYREHITAQKGTKKCADGETAVIVETKTGALWTYTEGSAHANMVKK